jgi:uncharacterized membrane protein YphA (DoxX/SURF4 family)
MTSIHLDPVVSWILRLAFAALFAMAAAHKIRDPRGFRQTLSDYQLLPRTLLMPAAIGLVAVEVLITIDLLTGSITHVFTGMISDTIAGRMANTPWAGLAACGLLLLYGLAIGVNLLRGRSEIDCGCLGPAGRQPLSSWLLVRNGILALGAALTTLPLSGRSLHAIDVITLSGGLLVLGLLFHTVNLLAADHSRWPTLERSQ